MEKRLDQGPLTIREPREDTRTPAVSFVSAAHNLDPAPPDRDTAANRDPGNRQTAARIRPVEEREVKFVVPLDAALRAVANSPKLEILQTYFADNELAKVKTVLDSIAPGSWPAGLELQQARLRRTASAQGVSYSLELKSPRGTTDDLKNSRQELSVPLSFEAYSCFLPFASGGSIRKDRYCLPGTINMPGGPSSATEQVHVVAHVDIFTEAAGKPVPHYKLRVATVDVEVANKAQENRLVAGDHTIGLVSLYGKEISSRQKMRSALSPRRVAKEGFDEKALRATRRLCPAD